ncbi:hypothetical protein DPEC_G00277700 [Dallia pectoralis]|uniref:Uncharacterized protein n=1 Tax=Dallia pectoralis TaxID=75939 RepID=A0ACC2FLU4_DALPE|nr:hypothetical protein DPEC_G00277700 [Dallia pectoralis]
MQFPYVPLMYDAAFHIFMGSCVGDLQLHHCPVSRPDEGLWSRVADGTRFFGRVPTFVPHNSLTSLRSRFSTPLASARPQHRPPAGVKVCERTARRRDGNGWTPGGMQLPDEMH